MGHPNESHLVIEAAIRGLCELLPEEGYAGWKIRESRSRSATSKIVRVERNGRPFMGFDREGSAFDFWFGADSLHLIKSFGPEMRRPEAGKNPGLHSNIAQFFQDSEYVWQVRLGTVDNAIALLEDLHA